MKLLGSQIIIFCLLKIYPHPGFGNSSVGWLVRKTEGRVREDHISLLDFLATSLWACTWDLAGYLLPAQARWWWVKDRDSWVLTLGSLGLPWLMYTFQPSPWESMPWISIIVPLYFLLVYVWWPVSVSFACNQDLLLWKNTFAYNS